MGMMKMMSANPTSGGSGGEHPWLVGSVLTFFVLTLFDYLLLPGN
jgi:hypothetical protein